VVWNGSQVACDDYIPNFCPYIYLGSGVRGLCWFAENDKGWGWEPGDAQYGGGPRRRNVLLRIHLINRPTVIDKPRTITFACWAAPVKPPLNTDANQPELVAGTVTRERPLLAGGDGHSTGSGLMPIPAGRSTLSARISISGKCSPRPTRKALSQEEIEAFHHLRRKALERR